jgi:hypothetical protein
MPAGGVVFADPCETLARVAALVGKYSRERSSNSRVECQDSMPSLSSAEQGLPIDCRIPGRPQAPRTVPEVYSASSTGRCNTGWLK